LFAPITFEVAGADQKQNWLAEGAYFCSRTCKLAAICHDSVSHFSIRHRRHPGQEKSDQIMKLLYKACGKYGMSHI
jgi:hypothetical protein